MEYNLIVNKAGSNLHNTASVKIEVMSEAALHAYNTLNGSNYKAYPTPCYALENGNIEFSSNDLYKTQAVTINPSELENYINTDATYVIPFELTQGTDSINSEKKYIFIKIMIMLIQRNIGTVNFIRYGRRRCVSRRRLYQVQKRGRL